MSGLELQEQQTSGVHPAHIFITRNGDVSGGARLQAGALDFLRSVSPELIDRTGNI